MEQTLVILKPEIIARGLVGRILQRLEDKGLRIRDLVLKQLERDTVEAHYAHHASRPFFPDLVDYMISGPVVLAVVEGPQAIAVVRNLCGHTNPAEAAPGTIRGDFSIELPANAIHASDSPEAAQAEIQRFFG
ncbi:MAG: nucleoside-diphosphate kinase [Limnochordia bacterium]|nr:nucleoside-diphosphate kinase [Bacillota bacterium]